MGILRFLLSKKSLWEKQYGSLGIILKGLSEARLKTISLSLKPASRDVTSKKTSKGVHGSIYFRTTSWESVFHMFPAGGRGEEWNDGSSR